MYIISAHVLCITSYTALCNNWETSPLTLPESHSQRFTEYHLFLEQSQETDGADERKIGFEGRGVSLRWAGLAAAQIAEGKWKEAKGSILTGERLLSPSEYNSVDCSYHAVTELS